MVTEKDIVIEIGKIVASNQNTLKLIKQPAFGFPLIAFASGSDKLFDFFKADIGEVLLLPHEWLARKHDRSFDRQNITVVCWALPQTESTKKKMRTQTEQPCKEWALNRTYGEAFNQSLAAQMETWFESQGVPAVAPMARPDFSWGRSEKYGYASNWSERHAAYIAGLGTFGLCDGLISKLGKAVRYGSVIAAVPLRPSARDYTTRREYCRADRGCTGCINRCPAGAITREGGHDKEKCVAYQKEHVVPYAQQAYGFEGTYGCGLCQTNVPCESRCPV